MQVKVEKRGIDPIMGSPDKRPNELGFVEIAPYVHVRHVVGKLKGWEWGAGGHIGTGLS